MTTYTIVAYRPNGVDTCRNCVMGTSDSAFEIEHSTSPEEAAKQWARFFMDDRKHRQDREVSSWEVTLLIDGKSYDFADDGEPYQLVEEAARAEFGRQVEVENAAAARAAEAAAEKKRADEEAARIRKEKAERALFIELQAKYGTPGVRVGAPSVPPSEKT